MKNYLIEDGELEVAMKVIIVGNGSVGKSSMIQRFCRGVFTRDYKKTIGVDFLERVLNIDGHTVRLMLWDTAGQEEFDAITRTYYRGASVCVLTCSITDKNSFTALPIWKTKVCRECGDDVPMVLVANKYDLSKQAVVDSAALEEMAKSLGITQVFKTSVKEDLNVLSVFTSLAQTYVTSYMTLDVNVKSVADDLLDSDSFLATIESLSLVPTDKPHHKFHTPVFNYYRPTNDHDQRTNNFWAKSNNRSKVVTKVRKPQKRGGDSIMGFRNVPKSFNPVIIRDQGKAFKKLSSSHAQNEKNYFFSSSGNHFTHWENMPFKLDPSSYQRHSKKKRDLCMIL